VLGADCGRPGVGIGCACRIRGPSGWRPGARGTIRLGPVFRPPGERVDPGTAHAPHPGDRISPLAVGRFEPTEDSADASPYRVPP
jgi:hypothetical protein